MLCSITSNNDLHVFQVTAQGSLVHGSLAAGSGPFPLDVIASGCDPQVAPTAQTFNNNLHVFARKTGGEIAWG